MPIIDLQRSVRQVGRIRIGEQAATNNGKLRPAKLDTFRLTSVQKPPIEKAAELYGGQVRPFDNDRSDDRWQVVTDADSLPVVIPPTHHLDQWLELWGGGGCDRRCDGQRMTVHEGRAVDQDCVCDPDNRACKITTRLWVVLPELEALGVWRIETHGWYAAVELAGAADLCAAVTAQGRAIPARLDLEQRTRRNQGKTFKFAVPVLSVDVSIPQARAILGGADTTTGELPARPREIAPVEPRQLDVRTPQPPAQLPPPPPATIPTPRSHDDYEAAQEGPATVTEEQVGEVVAMLNSITDPDNRKAVKRRFVELYGPPDQLTEDVYDDAFEWARSASTPTAAEIVAAPEVVDQPRLVDTPTDNGHTPITSDGADRYTPRQQKAFFDLWGKLAKREDWTEADRKERISAATGGRTDSWKDVTQLEADQLIGDLRALATGRA